MNRQPDCPECGKPYENELEAQIQTLQRERDEARQAARVAGNAHDSWPKPAIWGDPFVAKLSNSINERHKQSLKESIAIIESGECEHGSLKRSCEICDRDERIAELERERDEAQAERDEVLRKCGMQPNGLAEKKLIAAWMEAKRLRTAMAESMEAMGTSTLSYAILRNALKGEGE